MNHTTQTARMTSMPKIQSHISLKAWRFSRREPTFEQVSPHYFCDASRTLRF